MVFNFVILKQHKMNITIKKCKKRQNHTIHFQRDCNKIKLMLICEHSIKGAIL